MSKRAGLDKDAIIDDLGFRDSWNAKTVRMNVAAMAAILAAENPTVEGLRSAIEGLKIATEKELLELELCAIERKSLFSAPPSAKLLQFFRPSPVDMKDAPPRASVPA
jgi:hypothetical protein